MPPVTETAVGPPQVVASPEIVALGGVVTLIEAEPVAEALHPVLPAKVTVPVYKVLEVGLTLIVPAPEPFNVTFPVGLKETAEKGEPDTEIGVDPPQVFASPEIVAFGTGLNVNTVLVEALPSQPVTDAYVTFTL